MSSAEPDSSTSKDRKKSAHWSDTDTAILMQVLLQHKDAGRTLDNGFKPEVWRLAAEALHGVEHVGGPKTPDACKSRWQRLQRDYKAAKDMESFQGFTWDKAAGRLMAPPEAWEAAEKLSMDAYKHQKIHLPLYDQIAILCPLDGAVRKGRGKARSSLASSAASTELSHVQKQPENLAAAFESVNGNGNHHQHTHSHQEQPWAGLEAEMEYDEHAYGQMTGNANDDPNANAYGLPRPPKRHSHIMDPSLMASAASSPSSAKRQRPSPIMSSQQPQHVLAAAKFANGLVQQLPQGMRTPNGTHFIHQPQPQHHHTHLTQLPPTLTQHTPQPQAGPSHHHQHQPPQPPMMQLASRSPDFPNPALLDASSLQPAMALPSDVQSAGLSEPQRRSAAILMLQDRETDMADDDLVDIVTEFELNVTSADTYLALSKPGVRKVWLQRLLQRVATSGHTASGQNAGNSLNGNGNAFAMNGQNPNDSWGGRG